MWRFITLPAIVFCLLWTACSNTDFHTHIQGFWKVHQVQNNGETNYMYVQINDSILLYWYKDVNYIFPFQYRIEDNETLIVWLQNDPESRPTPIGKLSFDESNGFTLTNEHQRLEYRKSNYAEFKEETGKEWQPIK
ncbi:MAG: hypothetical protein R2824_06860 [Saprospiraceae bacterium]